MKCASQGVAIGSVSIGTFRPFPLARMREALAERQARGGVGKIAGAGTGRHRFHRCADGSGRLRYQSLHRDRRPGRTRHYPRCRFTRCCARAKDDALEPVTFLGLNLGIIERHLERENALRRSGPAAENILRDMGLVAARIG